VASRGSLKRHREARGWLAAGALALAWLESSCENKAISKSNEKLSA